MYQHFLYIWLRLFYKTPYKIFHLFIYLFYVVNIFPHAYVIERGIKFYASCLKEIRIIECIELYRENETICENYRNVSKDSNLSQL